MTTSQTTVEFNGFRIERDGARGDIVLNQPHKLNPLSTETLLDLEAAARWFDAQPDVRVVVVRGEGRVFSAGAHVAAFAPEAIANGFTYESGDAGRRMAESQRGKRASPSRRSILESPLPGEEFRAWCARLALP